MIKKWLKEQRFMVNLVSVGRMIKRVFTRKRKMYGLGYLPDKEDDRDIIYRSRRVTRELPVSTCGANIAQFPYRYDQGQLGSCVGNGVSAMFRRVLQVNQMPDFEPSRLFAYFIARRDKMNDTGASIRDAFKAMNRFGLCSEKAWPYVERKFNVYPSIEAFDEAIDHQTIRYERIFPVTKDLIRDAVSSGFPVGYGKMLYESFMSDRVKRTGIIPIPDTRSEQLYGGHFGTIFDYDEEGTIELNSWGQCWGQRGTCKVPWAYVLDAELCRDFWVIYLTE